MKEQIHLKNNELRNHAKAVCNDLDIFQKVNGELRNVAGGRSCNLMNGKPTSGAIHLALRYAPYADIAKLTVAGLE